MAFPISPVNGQIYNGYIYDATKGAWCRTGAIVEEGSNSFGTYIVYSNGLHICRGTIAQSATATYDSGGIYPNYTNISIQTLPKAYASINNYQVFCTAEVNQGAYTVSCHFWKNSASEFGVRRECSHSASITAAKISWMTMGYN